MIHNDSKIAKEFQILDWLHCSIVCENSKELMRVYHKICNDFKNEMISVKNEFNKNEKTKYGYRCVIINVIYEHLNFELKNKGFKMIAEIRLKLANYYQTKNNMQFGGYLSLCECECVCICVLRIVLCFNLACNILAYVKQKLTVCSTKYAKQTNL